MRAASLAVPGNSNRGVAARRIGPVASANSSSVCGLGSSSAATGTSDTAGPTSTATAAAEFTRVARFFSIGTNDLTSEVLGIARDDPRMRPARAADPDVLTLIARVARAAAAAGISVSVCGDAAADPGVLPLLLGLGVRTLSVGAARVAEVADQVRRAHAERCAELADRVLLKGTIETIPGRAS